MNSALQLEGNSDQYRNYTENQIEYWKPAIETGVTWLDEPGGALDNHSHGLNILGKAINGNSGYHQLEIDLSIKNALNAFLDVDILLNSFTINRYKQILQFSHDNQNTINKDLEIGTRIICAKTTNLVNKQGPDPDVFEKISSNNFVKDFRKFIREKNVKDANLVYSDVLNEIKEAEKAAIKKSARELRPANGIASLAMEVAQDALGIGAIKKTAELYLNSQKTHAIGAAAFLLDFE